MNHWWSFCLRLQPQNKEKGGDKIIAAQVRETTEYSGPLTHFLFEHVAFPDVGCTRLVKETRNNRKHEDQMN